MIKKKPEILKKVPKTVRRHGRAPSNKSKKTKVEKLIKLANP